LLTSRRFVRALGAVVAAAGLVAAAPVPASAAPRVANPTKNEPLTKAMVRDCDTFPTATLATCNAASLAGIDGARRKEHVAPMKFPSNYLHLTLAEQLFVVNNLERRARGLTPVPGLSTALNAMAQQGADANVDPWGPSAYSWGSSWGETFEGALMLDYMLMYDDGRGGNNIDCQRGNFTGCWGHRDDILNTQWTRKSESGFASHADQRFKVGGRRYAVESVTSLFVAGYRSGHKLAFTWAAEARLKQVHFSRLK
jgi:hypothetical protein